MPEQVFNFTGGTQTFTVPSWVTSLTVEVAGAQGGSIQNGNVARSGGSGGLVTGTIDVTPGQVLSLIIGGQNGFNGGGNPGTLQGANPGFASGKGGGKSVLYRVGTAWPDILVVAGGGGGAAGLQANGGAGGGLVGGTGEQIFPTVDGYGGGGGTQSLGGAPGASFAGGGGNGGTGVSQTGAAGGNQQVSGALYNESSPGGGGGGGYFGGGGGGAGGGVFSNGGGGGGGSSFTAAAVLNVQHTQGNRAGNGYIKISYGSPQDTAPTNIIPTAGSTVATNTPTLGATIVAQGTARQRVEWHLATSSDFIAGLRVITEPTSKLKVSGVTTEVVPLVSKLFQGNWYVRAHTLDEGNVASPWSVTQQFTVAHVPAASPISPFSGQVLAYNPVGLSLTWLFSDSSPDDIQSAYQVVVTDAATGASVADTGKVPTLAKTANVVIPISKKNSQLSWRVRVWDADNVVGPYSNAVTFVVADAPGITVTAMTTVATSAPLVTFSFTPVVAPLANYRVTIIKVSDSSLVYDSGWVGA